MGLPSVIADLDGIGVSLRYPFYGKSGSYIGSSSNAPELSTSTFEPFFKPLRDAGSNLSFFGCDKDKAEITAILKVWPSCTAQHCF